MKLEGEIWELELIPQLVELGSQGFTGAIRFENDSVIKIVYFKDGNILSASTNDRADSIDEILLKSGKVTRDHVKQALSKRKETETLGDALLGLGFIAKRELAWARRVQLIGILRSIAEWKGGTFTVVADYLPKREEGTSFPLPQVVLELVLTDQDRARYDQLLESGSAVFRKSASFDGAFPSLGLNQEASAIAGRIDGSLSASEIASESGSDAFNVYKLLNALNLLGLIEKTEKSLEVSPVPPAATGAFGAPDSATVEMSLNFVGDASEPGAAAQFDEAPTSGGAVSDEFVSESSVPAEDLLGYDFEAPAAEQVEDLGIHYAEPAAIDDKPATRPAPESEGLGSLESLRNFEVPAAPFPPIEERIAERKQQKSKPLSAPPASGGRRKVGLIAAGAIAVVVLACAGGWYYLTQRVSSDSVDIAQVAPQVPSPTPSSTAGGPGVSSSSADTVISSTGPAGADTAGGEATSSTGVESETAGGVQRTETAPAVSAPAKAAAPSLKVPPPVTQPPVKPQPTQSPAPAAASPGTSDASSKYAIQAQQYAREAAAVPYTVQFELVCKDASVKKAIDIGGSKIWFHPITYKGQQCYRVFWGRYSNRADAERGAGEIPAALRGGKPSVISPGSTR